MLSSQEKNIKVLLWAPFGAGTHYWGPGTSAFRLYKSVKNHDRVSIDLAHSSSKQGVFPDVYEKQIYLKGLEKGGVLGMIVFLFKSIFWILKNHKNYDVVHGLSAYYYTFLPLYIFSLLKVSTVIKITGSNSGLGNNSRLSKILGLSFLRSRCIRSMDYFVCISDEIERNLLSNGINKSKIERIPNGVDVDRFKAYKDEETIVEQRSILGLENKFTILFIGGLTENKRVYELSKAVAELILEEQEEDLQLLIVGPDRSNGVIHNKIEKLIASRRLEKSIRMIEHTSEPEYLYGVSDVFVLPSKREGMSNALLEAMSSSLTVLCTNVSGSSDLISHLENGMILESGDVSGIKIALKKLKEDRELCRKLAKKARKTIEDNYSVSEIFSRHVELFKRLKEDGLK